MLTGFLARLAAVVHEVPGSEGFVLAGGGALTVHGRIGRITRDLDYFARTPSEVDALLPALERALSDAGFKVERQQVGSGFARLNASDGQEEARIDLGYDFRLMEPAQTELGPVLSEEELAADKVLAVHGRLEARDYLDLHVLVGRFGYIRPLEWAKQKDPGFSRAVFAERLGRMDTLPRHTFEAPDHVYERVKRDLEAWRDRLVYLERTAERAKGGEPELDLRLEGRERGPDRGRGGPGLDF